MSSTRRAIYPRNRPSRNTSSMGPGLRLNGSNIRPTTFFIVRSSSQSCTKSDATDIRPAGVSAPNPSLTISSLETGTPLATTWERDLRPEPNEAKFMPEYDAVHDHCSRVTGYLEFVHANIMQSYEYSLLNIGLL